MGNQQWSQLLINTCIKKDKHHFGRGGLEMIKTYKIKPHYNHHHYWAIGNNLDHPWATKIYQLNHYCYYSYCQFKWPEMIQVVPRWPDKSIYAKLILLIKKEIFGWTYINLRHQLVTGNYPSHVHGWSELVYTIFRGQI
jgi:hypothetical protein